jgi:exonuclease III
MSYIILRGLWCDIIVLNVHAPTEDKIDDIKDSFYEELERAFDKLPKYHMKVLLGDFNAKVGKEDIFKPIIGNESFHEINNDNGVRVVNFCHIHECTWT